MTYLLRFYPLPLDLHPPNCRVAQLVPRVLTAKVLALASRASVHPLTIAAQPIACTLTVHVLPARFPLLTDMTPKPLPSPPIPLPAHWHSLPPTDLLPAHLRPPPRPTPAHPSLPPGSSPVSSTHPHRSSIRCYHLHSSVYRSCPHRAINFVLTSPRNLPILPVTVPIDLHSTRPPQAPPTLPIFRAASPHFPPPRPTVRCQPTQPSQNDDDDNLTLPSQAVPRPPTPLLVPQKSTFRTSQGHNSKTKASLKTAGARATTRANVNLDASSHHHHLVSTTNLTAVIGISNREDHAGTAIFTPEWM
ncbi:hypothetical protein EDB84DRAFT_1561977 [Lactarius hengduanensis]|nr:hypothetical protein EDB84DRAFT_1561977 [Lactarius hengduanensis]